MSADEALQLIDEFRRRRGDLRLARHAALPAALSPDLVHLLRVNFLLDEPDPPPATAEFDLLFSPLCHEIGEGLYAMEPGVRAVLLRETQALYGDERLRDIASLLWQYTQRTHVWADRPGLERAQQLTALNFLAPERALAWLAAAEEQSGRDTAVEQPWLVAMRRELALRPEAGETVPPAAARQLEQHRHTLADAVCLIEMPDQQCTGFLVGPNLVITLVGPQVFDDTQAEATAVTFERDGVPFRCTIADYRRLAFPGAEGRYAVEVVVLRVSPTPAASAGAGSWLTIGSDPPQEGAPICTCFFDKARQKSFAVGVALGEGRLGIGHTLDVSLGAMGAPIVNLEGQVVAIPVGYHSDDGQQFALPLQPVAEQLSAALRELRGEPAEPQRQASDVALRVVPRMLSVVVHESEPYIAILNLNCELTNDGAAQVTVQQLEAELTTPGNRRLRLVWNVFYDFQPSGQAGGRMTKTTDAGPIEIAASERRSLGVQFLGGAVQPRQFWPPGVYTLELTGLVTGQPGSEPASVQQRFTVTVGIAESNLVRYWSRATEAQWRQLRDPDRAVGIPVRIEDAEPQAPTAPDEPREGAPLPLAVLGGFFVPPGERIELSVENRMAIDALAQARATGGYILLAYVPSLQYEPYALGETRELPPFGVLARVDEARLSEGEALPAFTIESRERVRLLSATLVAPFYTAAWKRDAPRAPAGQDTEQLYANVQRQLETFAALRPAHTAQVARLREGRDIGPLADRLIGMVPYLEETERLELFYEEDGLTRLQRASIALQRGIEKTRRRDELLAQARAAVEGGEPLAIAEALGTLLAEFPDDPEAQELQEEALERQNVPERTADTPRRKGQRTEESRADAPEGASGPLTQEEFEREARLGMEDFERNAVRDAYGRFEQLLARIEAQPEGQQPGRGSAEHAITLHWLGSCLMRIGDLEGAEARLSDALELYRVHGATREAAHALQDLGQIHLARGNALSAIACYEQSLLVMREIGDRWGEGFALGGLGNAYASLDEHQRAIELHEQRLAIVREIGDRQGEGASLSYLGNAYASLGEHQRAIDFYLQALAIARELGDRGEEARVSWSLGEALEELGDLRGAVEAMQLRVDYERETEDPEAEAHAARVAELRRRIEEDDTRPA